MDTDITWKDLHPLSESSKRPPHPHKPAASKAAWPPIRWTGISFDEFGGAPDGTKDLPEKHPLPWTIDLYAADLARKYLRLALERKNWTEKDLARETGLPVPVVSDIVRYGYGWTPDFTRILTALEIDSFQVPPECY